MTRKLESVMALRKRFQVRLSFRMYQRRKAECYWHPQLFRYVEAEGVQVYLDAGWHLDTSDRSLYGHEQSLCRPLPKTLKLPDDVVKAPSLPPELWYQILSYLQEPQLIETAQCCEHFCIVSQWFMIQRIECGHVERREGIDLHRIPSLMRFIERWQRKSSFLHRLMPASPEQIPLLRNVILGGGMTDLQLEVNYGKLEYDLRRMVWHWLPHPSFLRLHMKERCHPARLLLIVLAVLLDIPNVYLFRRDTYGNQVKLSASDRNALTDSQTQELRVMADELYQSCWYFLRYCSRVKPSQFGPDSYREIFTLISRDEGDVSDIDDYM